MKKNKLIEIRTRLLAAAIAGVMLGTAGCTNKQNEDGVPQYTPISSKYSNLDDYYINITENDKVIKLYNCRDVYFFFDKQTYEVNEYIYHYGIDGIELYDLESGELLVYGDEPNNIYNEDYYKYLLEHTYQICLAEAGDYTDGYTYNEYYPIDVIKKLEPQLIKRLRDMNKSKVRTK